MTARPRMLRSGRYQGLTYDPVAKKAGPTKVFDHEYEARDWARAWEQDRARSARTHGIEYTTRASSVPTFAEFARSWRRGGPPSTQTTHRSQARQLAKIWPTQRIDKITKADVEAAFVNMEASGLSASTRSVRLSVLRHVIRDAITAGHREDDPTAGLKGPKMRRSAGKHRPVTDAELDAIMLHLPGWMECAVLLARDSGLRISECAGIRWHRIDLTAATAVVADVVLGDGSTRDTPKNGIAGVVPLSPRTVTALREQAARTPGHKRTDRVLTYAGRGGVREASPAAIRQRWNTAVAAAEITDPRPRFHDLRHSRAHSLARAGVRIEHIQAIMRHESIEMTRLYCGPVPVAEMAAALATADGSGQAPTVAAA